MITNSGNEAPGQRGGLLGSRYDPFPVRPDPAAANFRAPELHLGDQMPTVRFNRRCFLLRTVDSVSHLAERAAGAAGLGAFQGQALDLIGAAKTHQALNIQREDAALRDRYGRTGFGQRLLLTRRLFEVGVPCVTVHWLDAGPVVGLPQQQLPWP